MTLLPVNICYQVVGFHSLPVETSKHMFLELSTSYTDSVAVVLIYLCKNVFLYQIQNNQKLAEINHWVNRHE